MSSPLSKQEEILHTTLTKRKLHFAADKSTVFCKTHSQPNQRHIICKNTGVQHKRYVTKKLALAMKTTIGLSWSQHRTQKRFLKQVDVTFDYESLEREEMQVILSEYLTAKTIDVIEKDELAPQSVDSFKTVKAPFVRVTSLTSFVVDLITIYDQRGKLNWDRGISDDEIWVKVGGDHGGGSFKLAVQVCNLDNPNS